MIKFDILKKLSSNIILLFLFSIISTNAFAQACPGSHATVSMDNLTQTALNKIEFDVQVKNTGSTILCVTALPGGFTFNAGFLNGGTVTATATLSTMFSILNPINPVVQVPTSQVRWSHIPIPGTCAVLSGPGASSIKHQVAHMVLTNTVPFDTCFPVDFTWNDGLGVQYSNVMATIYCNGNINSSNLAADGLGTYLDVQNAPVLVVNCCPTSLDTDIVNTCPGTNNGDALISILSPATFSAGNYSLNGGSAQTYSGLSIHLPGLAAGSYTITVDDTLTNLCSPLTTTFVVGNLPVQAPVVTIATACDTYLWTQNSTSYTSSGTYTTTYTGLNGCNVTDTLLLNITPSNSVVTNETACVNYTWPVNGSVYTSSGTYTYQSGCTSYTLNLTILPLTNITSSETSCDSYTWPANGVTYTSSGTYTYIQGCTSQILNLTIIPSSTVVSTESTCGSYTWPINGNTYSTGGSYFAQVGCITHQLLLSIVPISNDTTTLVKCVTYTWPVTNTTYTTSGTYLYTNGCENKVLQLTIQPKSGTIVTKDTGCNYYIWYPNAQMYTSTGTYYWYSPSCLEYVLNLVISTPSSTTTSISSAGSYYWPLTGLFYSYSGTYYNTGSICHVDTLFLTVLPSSVDNVQTNKSILTISPNPTSDRIKVKLATYHESDVEVKLFDITGRLVSRQQARTVSGNNEFEFQMSHLANGVYAIQVIEDGKLVHVNKVQKSN